MNRVIIFSALAALAACSRNVIDSNGIPVHAAIWEQTENEVLARARIDLVCQAVEVLLVSRQGKFPVEVSAQGCGRQAIYHRQLRHHLGHSTTSNTVWEAVAVSPPPPVTAPIANEATITDNLPPQPY